MVSLDHDRILRSYLTLIRATLRTNFFQRTADGDVHPYMSFKLEPSAIPDLPEPRPRYEIFVYSPRVEGSHLRFGAVARGGLRWSDRRDDFRTEVLGLVKAQMVKNTVIVPVGAKGAFFCKQLPDPSDRDAWLAEGVACYKTFISGLLDITDNLVDGETVPPREVVRHDGDDSYLVVAADKGTATFSDIANGVAKDYGFWLGDAFASGGSVGYDHKAMGITAKGAWVSVQRHFREMGVDCQAEDFTAVGIGDMSGDVFGNGLLCSEHTRLVAAFDHRDIFIDPAPDAASSYAERQRLFDLPRSSWKDYDTSLISEGGGVWPRSAKSIPVSAQVREALGLGADVTALTPAELMKAILLAPVDLLWNGGIGTYVKASEETNADAGDKANDAIRVNGEDLRAKCVGEGGNLGFTQLGRVEYARYGAGGDGGRMNTDFIDNSAGVDTSDHEVNIKILLDRVVRVGRDGRGRRATQLLAEMTDEVGALVLRDNYEQNLALANAEAHAPSLLHVHEEWMRALEKRGVLNRDLEGLPDHAPGAAPPRPQAGAVGARAVGAAGLDQDRARRRADRLRPARRPLPARGPAGLLPPADGARPRGGHRGPPAAPRDHRDPGRQRPGQRRRHDLLAAAGGGDRRQRGRPDPRQLRGPRDLRLAAAAPGDRRARQPGAGRAPDPDAHRDAHARRARVALAGDQPASAARLAGDGRLLPRAGAGRDGRAAGDHERPRARRLPGARAAPRRPRRARRPGLARRGAGLGVRPARHRRDRPTGSASTRSRWPASTSPSASGSACRPWSSGSSRCRATTAGRRWRGPRCATTSTACTSS